MADVRSRAIDIASQQRGTSARQKATADRIESLDHRLAKSSDKTRAEVSATRERVRDDVGKIRTDVDRLRDKANQIADRIERAGGRLSALGEAVDALTKSARDLQNFQRHALRQTRDYVTDAVRNVDATLQLSRSRAPRGPLPPTGGFAITAQNLLLLTALAQHARPRRIVELGSGTSTVWLGYIAEETDAQMISFEHVDSYAELTRAWLDHSGLGTVVELRVAPLEDVEIGAVAQPWYTLSAFADLSDIDFLFIDGPPKATAEQARFPALPLLVDRLADEAWIVLDDAGRPDEEAAVARWLDEVPGLDQLPSVSERLAILRFRRPPARDDHTNASGKA